jgi:16S rRNA G966 N2-methylase RsmD
MSATSEEGKVTTTGDGAILSRSCETSNKCTEQEVVLPGYDAGIDTSGIQHSHQKLKVSAGLLFEKLKEIQTQHQQFVSDERYLDEQLASASPNHRSMIGGMNGSIQTFHCRDEKETWTYRCRCNFQIVRVSASSVTTTSASTTSYRYAMRSMGKPVLLGTKNSFPIATRRIQTAMNEFMEHLNNNKNENNETNGDDDGDSCSDLIGQNGHLTSCTFSSAWRDTPDADCVLTLHYDHPLDGDDGTTKKRSWKRQASLLCRKLRLRQLNGRSKGTLLSVTGGEILKNENDECKTDDEAEAEATIRDTIFLLRKNCDNSTRNETDCATIQDEWEVSLDDDKVVLPDTKSIVAIPVHYDKPETAFYHPNPNAMTTALSWMLNRLVSISSSSFSSTTTTTSPIQQKQLNLLEMYCGCGAHTVALGRSGLVSNILAVELDPRLVRACEANVARNSLQDLVEVRKGDAGRWAKEESRKRRSSRRRRTNNNKNLEAMRNDIDIHVDEDREADDNNRENYYDVLLVDPPRQGLDEEVCKMAMMTIDGEVGVGGGDTGESGSQSCFRNILYVSCGHQALLRDLERLSPVYEVVNCAQMDLFPRTDSIETLVHLRRRRETA